MRSDTHFDGYEHFLGCDSEFSRFEKGAIVELRDSTICVGVRYCFRGAAHQWVSE